MAQRDVWPSEEDFVEFDKVIKCRDLEKGIHRFCNYKETMSSYGDAFILQLETQAGKPFWHHKGKVISFWRRITTSGLMRVLQNQRRQGGSISNSHCYFVNFRYDLPTSYIVA